MAIPDIRLTQVNSASLRDDGQYVLYWMIAFRRTGWNFALEHAVDHARRLNKPLIIFEPLRVRYRWASDRLHRFVIEGMRDNAASLRDKPVTYFPYVEPRPGVGTPLLHRLAKQACVVVTDDYPCFFLPHMIQAVRDRLPARLEMVDSNGLVPLRLADRTFTVAHSYRRWMQKQIAPLLEETPQADPLGDVKLPLLDQIPEPIRQRWPAADLEQLLGDGGLRSIPIDHSVGPAAMRGGAKSAQRILEAFLAKRLNAYDSERNHPDQWGSTGLSPYLHFGHLAAHQIVADLMRCENWVPAKLGKPNGKNHDFWNTSVPAEALLDQLLTWREMGFNMTHRHPETYADFDSLPSWALTTLAEHASDPRPHLYSLRQFESAETHDPLWNAAQRELVRDGRMHNYMRMLWGKKILHWTFSPRDALEIMIHLNNKYAVDGRDPNSYSGIFWTLGRYDRAWGPKRPVFGSVRYMTSDSTRKKLKLSKYLQQYGPDSLFSGQPT
jgi:deoxyribodipyrimidine photo-lyase